MRHKLDLESACNDAFNSQIFIEVIPPERGSACAQIHNL